MHDGNQQPQPDDRDWGRVRFLALLLGIVVFDTACNTSSSLPSQTPQPTGDPQQFNENIGNDVAATATAGAVKEVIGDAPGHFPEKVIQAALKATGILSITMKNGGSIGTGSIIKVGNEVGLLSAACMEWCGCRWGQVHTRGYHECVFPYS
jgi:hypothetical protein